MSNEAKDIIPEATAQLAEFCHRVTFDALPAAVVERLKLSILDSLACCLQGATLPWIRHIQEMVGEERAEPVASVFGTPFKSSVANAVLAYASAGHAFELDDIHKESIIHPGSIALPVAFGLAEKRGGVDGKEALTAMAAGYEVGTRVGSAATMALFFRGFHPQGSSGVFVAAATAAKAMQLSAGQTQHAFGIAGSQAGGLMAAQEGAMVKRFHSGRAAQSGVYSAQLAQRGFTGTRNVLEAGYGGYLSTYSGDPAPDRLLDRVGAKWEILQVGYKPHASVTSIHTALDGLQSIMREYGLNAENIECIEVGVSRMTHGHCAWTYTAQGVTAAQMNLFYGLAMMAIDGVVFVNQFDEGRLKDARVLELIARMEAHIDPEIEAMGAPYRHASVVKVTTRAGATYSRKTLNRRGSPEDPLSAKDIQDKFRAVTANVLAPATAEMIIERVAQFERERDVGHLTQEIANACLTNRSA
jgi:2-methylcitrate dehydratase PrpD